MAVTKEQRWQHKSTRKTFGGGGGFFGVVWCVEDGIEGDGLGLWKR